MKKIIYISFIFFVCFTSCNHYDLEKWRNDKKVANNYRNIENTDLLLKKYNVKDLNINEIKKTLGQPDRLIRINNTIYLQYYIENNCEVKDVDCCLLTIVYSNSKAKTSITCM